MNNIDKENFIKICNESLTMSEASRKLGLHFNTFKRYAIEFNCWQPNPAGKGMKKKPSPKRIPTDKILNGEYPDYQTFKLKNRLFSEGYKERKCEKCGLTMWNGLPIPLELHHKDGNRTNHKLDNIEILCLNCHAQTETFRAKNINH